MKTKHTQEEKMGEYIDGILFTAFILFLLSSFIDSL